ncbi:hypothetical protein [Bordetella genomosp. 11]|uniref:Uncharacterized protein n=1 Tax=Bordetella genomosp. 11 TaxID=1416808 RepID=A0A261UG96_9BORD|nr:hypothetical protein [Bordetella genomosp. 11]OZI59903.1 hypothetical protein CAL28_10460 [Bordetella genomosp. 11]
MTITIIKANPEPLYKVECCHCRTIFTHNKSDVIASYVKCPVCNNSIMFDDNRRFDPVEEFRRAAAQGDGDGN